MYMYSINKLIKFLISTYTRIIEECLNTILLFQNIANPSYFAQIQTIKWIRTSMTKLNISQISDEILKRHSIRSSHDRTSHPNKRRQRHLPSPCNFNNHRFALQPPLFYTPTHADTCTREYLISAEISERCKVFDRLKVRPLAPTNDFGTSRDVLFAVQFACTRSVLIQCAHLCFPSEPAWCAPNEPGLCNFCRALSQKCDRGL